MKAGIIAAGTLVVLIALGTFYFLYQPTTSPEGLQQITQPEVAQDKMVIENSQTIDSIQTIGSDNKVNKQASFAIFTNGTFRIFTDSMYHNLSEDVFIQSSDPNIVQVKKAGITWGDFFKTLPFKLTKECLTTGTGQTFCTGKDGSLKFYLNGQLDNEALSKTINQGDKLLVSFGNDGEAQITSQLERIPNP